MINVGIVGSTGYGGCELVRFLLTHPNVNIEWVSSRTYSDQEYSDVYKSYFTLLDQKCVDEDIEKFESGLQTVVGERGVTLSGGQRQRISLLRTIMKNKKILILDDTLSAVDNIVASKIKESLKKEKATTIIISHNLLNVKHADKILVLEDGKISDIGTHDELIKKEGYYSNVWNIQQMIEEVQE